MSDTTGALALRSRWPKADWLPADRGYRAIGPRTVARADWFRKTLLDRGTKPCIPGRSSRDRPIKHDKRRTKRRPRIEMMFDCLKDWRLVATRYDRCPVVLAATVMAWIGGLSLARTIPRLDAEPHAKSPRQTNGCIGTGDRGPKNADITKGEFRLMAEIDLHSLSRDELTQLRADVDRAITAAGERERRMAREAAEAAAKEHGFSLAELTGGASTGAGRGRRGSRSGPTDAGARGRRGRGDPDGSASSLAPSEAKYRNPENAQETWSGRGRRPQWVHAALEGGRALSDLAA